MDEPKVGILIVNWNGYKLTSACIKSLEKVAYKNYHIYVVDNGSSDGSPDKIRQEFPLVNLITSTKNLGFSGGNNLGIKKILSSDYKYILLLNNDTEVDPHFLSELIKTALTNPNAGIVGGKIYYYNNPHMIWAAGSSCNLKKATFINRGYHETDVGQFNREEQVDFINGCCMLVDTQAMRKVNGFDDDYFAYVEDVDLNMRIKREGYNVYYNPKSIIYHHISASTGGESNKIKEYLKARNGFIFARKNLKGETQRSFYIHFTWNKLQEIFYRLSHLKLSATIGIIEGVSSGIYYTFSSNSL